MKKRNLLALLLALCLVLSGCVLPPAMDLSNYVDLGTGGEDPDPTPYAPDGDTWQFRDLEYERPDLEAFRALTEQALDQANNGAKTFRIASTLDQVEKAYSLYYTMQNLADIRYSMDMSDDYYREEYNYCMEHAPELEAIYDDLYYSLAESPAAEALEKGYFGENYFAENWNPEDADFWDDGTLQDMQTRENQLISAYHEAAMEAWEDHADDEDYDGYYADLGKTAGPILVDLILVRHEMARYFGYENTEQFLWDWNYSRDFDPGQAAREGQLVAEYLAPIYREMWDKTSTSLLYSKKAGASRCSHYVGSAAEAMGGWILEAWEFMQAHGLYDMEPNPYRYNGSFEVYLTDFDTPFVLINPTGTVEDMGSLAHEFGHFVNDYTAEGSYCSVDVSEIFSQSMEYLCTIYAQEDSSTLERMRRLRLLESLDTYVEQMAYYTFESEIYALDPEELDVDTIDHIYKDVCCRYSLDVVGITPYEWTDVTHFYTDPFYVISYVISNDAATQIYQMELAEAGSGLELFEEMVQVYEDWGFVDFVTSYGLESPLDESRVPSVAALLREELIG